jgi:LasA protease
MPASASGIPPVRVDLPAARMCTLPGVIMGNGFRPIKPYPSIWMVGYPRAGAKSMTAISSSMELSLKRLATTVRKIKFLVKGLFCTGLLFCFLFSGCASPTPVPTVATQPIQPPSPAPTIYLLPNGYVEYIAQSGDTAAVVAAHFNTEPEKIFSPDPIPQFDLINPGQKLYLPAYSGSTTPLEILFPDSEVVYSPSAVDFDIQQFVNSTSGKLKDYSEVSSYPMSGADIIFQLGRDYSINPRILLTLLEYEGKWVVGNAETYNQRYYPFGYINVNEGALFHQTAWAVQQLTAGYYGWRSGTLTNLVFPDDSTLRLAPDLNAGTVAVMYFLSQIHNQVDWQSALQALPAIHTQLFGDYWARARTVEPLFPAGLKQPELRFPFPLNETWNYTCGPHTAWGESEQPKAALDFAPPLDTAGCGTSPHWATAMASGLVTRAWNGAVYVDLDGDGKEQTGWVLLYMHIGGVGRVNPGVMVNTGDRIGHPSCEGGSSSGIHVHVARKYNGEWVLADGGLPFTLSGYVAKNSDKFCEGLLVKGNVTVFAYPWGSWKTKICQPESQKCTMATPTPIPSLTPTFKPKTTPTFKVTAKP